MDRKRLASVVVSFALGFFGVLGVMAVAAVAYCTRAGTVCTIEGER